MEFQPRDLSPDERRMLRSLRKRTQKARNGWIKPWHYIVAAALGAGCAWAAFHTGAGFLLFLCGTIAVLAVGFVVFTPGVVLKQIRERRELLRRLDAFIERGTVGIHPVSATRIALAREYEDEGDLYIVEIAGGRVLYLYDVEYNTRSKFPCLRFEIYDDEFFTLTGKRVLPSSDRVRPVAIDPKRKWDYFMSVGAPGNLTVEETDFDELVERYGNPVPLEHEAT